MAKIKRFKVTETKVIQLDGKYETLQEGTFLEQCEKGGRLVSEDSEVVLDGDIFVLDAGDRIKLSEAQLAKKPKPPATAPTNPTPLPDEDEFEEEEGYDEGGYDQEYNEEQ